jgi:hypothetical protein
MKKLLILLFSLFFSFNSLAGTSFVCTDWEGSEGTFSGTLMIGEKIGENFSIRDHYKEERLLNYIGRYNAYINLYSSKVPQFKESVGIFSISTSEYNTKGYDFRITKWTLNNFVKTFCNYQ